MENIKSTLIALALALGIAVFLAVVYLLYAQVFGDGLVGDLLSILVSIFFMVFSLLSLGAAILVCMDVLKSEKMDWKAKISWVLLVWFFGVFGAIIYYLTEKRGGGFSGRAADRLLAMRPSVSTPVVASFFIGGIILLLGTVFVPDLGMALLILGMGMVFVSLYLSKKMHV